MGIWSHNDGRITEGVWKDGKLIDSTAKANNVNVQSNINQQNGMSRAEKLSIFSSIIYFIGRMLWWLASDNTASAPSAGRITQKHVCLRGHELTSNMGNTPNKCPICDSSVTRKL